MKFASILHRFFRSIIAFEPHLVSVSQWLKRPVSSLLLGFIHLYQLVISPVFPASCRFHPSCSEYTRRAIKTHGAVRGCVLGLRRLLTCHPWGGSGFDPVPQRDDQANAESASTDITLR